MYKVLIYRFMRNANWDVMITVTIDVILISLMGAGTVAFPVLMLLHVHIIHIILIELVID